MTLDIRNNSLSERLPEHIFERVHRDIGQASMCWEDVNGAGVFDLTKSSEISNNLCHFIADEMENLKTGWDKTFNTTE